MHLYIPMDPHLFYTVEGGYAMNRGPNTLEQGTDVEIGDPIPLSCMFEARWLLQHGKKVGYFFSSSFQVQNDGGYLYAFIGSQRGTADRVEILLKTEDLVVFHYPGKGTLIANPRINEELGVIFKEQ
jgi:hypothetical protein